MNLNKIHEAIGLVLILWKFYFATWNGKQKKIQNDRAKLYRKDNEEIILQDIMILSLFLLKSLYVKLIQNGA